MRIAAGLAERAGRRHGPPNPPGTPEIAGAESLPLLRESPEGRVFLAAAGPRAFALGRPADRCPGRAAAAGSAPEAAAEAALSACLGQVAEAGADCGCEVIALGDVALAPRPTYAYAPGVSARLIAPRAGIDLALVAREEPGPDGARRLLFHPAPVAPAEALIRPDGSVALTLGAETWEGTRRAEGLDRGRFRERLDLRRADGARMVVAVGWEPVAFAVERKALLGPLFPPLGG